jgi:hypothetical protein
MAPNGGVDGTANGRDLRPEGRAGLRQADHLEPLPNDRLPAWHQPRVAALRTLIVGSDR